MDTFNAMLIARNEIANRLETLISSLKLSEKDAIFILDSILNDTRLKCMTREAYSIAFKENDEKRTEDKQEISEENNE